MDDAPNQTISYSIPCSDGFLRCPGSVFGENGTDLQFRKFHHRMPLAAPNFRGHPSRPVVVAGIINEAPFPSAIIHILLMCSDEEVVDADAECVVARMTHTHVGWQRCVIKRLPSETVDTEQPLAYAHGSVSTIVRPTPLVAIIWPCADKCGAKLQTFLDTALSFCAIVTAHLISSLQVPCSGPRKRRRGFFLHQYGTSADATWTKIVGHRGLASIENPG